MNWLEILFGKKSEPTEGEEYRVANILYSADTKRCVEVRRFASGKTYIMERDLSDDGAYVDRHGGAMVGPFEPPRRAELFIVATPWFRGDETGPT